MAASHTPIRFPMPGEGDRATRLANPATANVARVMRMVATTRSFAVALLVEEQHELPPLHPVMSAIPSNSDPNPRRLTSTGTSPGVPADQATGSRNAYRLFVFLSAMFRPATLSTSHSN